ncbi:hypothetical protein TNCV_2936741 [Trichonephila clavipes]|nr:hypothetical protein TNCV_2936741 [Trichonephila clavipes]
MELAGHLHDNSYKPFLVADSAYPLLSWSESNESVPSTSQHHLSVSESPLNLEITPDSPGHLDGEETPLGRWISKGSDPP